MKFIPFGMTPAGLGLKGKDRDKAQAYYELTEEKLHRRLCEIDFEKESKEYNRRMKELDIEYDFFENEEAREYAFLELEYLDDNISNEYIIAKADLDLKYKKITQVEYDKSEATINNKPWVGYKDYAVEDTEEGGMGFWFDFDWNSKFIAKLKEEGYEGINEEEMVRRWYAELCRTIALEEGLALDIFGDGGEVEVEAGPSSPNVTTNKTKVDDEHTKYS